MVRVADVGTEPVDVAGQLALVGVVDVENVSASAPVRFVVAEAAGEAAPADRVGHLLRPGERVAVEVRAGAPLWIWSQGPAAVAVGPRLA